MPLLLPPSPARPILRQLIAAGLDAADPFHGILRCVSLEGDALRVGRRRYNLRRVERIFAVGAGKASARMAQAIERTLGTRLNGGLVVVKKGYRRRTRRIAVVEAGHPIPDRAGLRAAKELRHLAQSLTTRDLLLVLLSGGASSLLPAPVPGVTLADKQRTTRLLLRAGASIHEVNAVRKHLSLLKGGRLATSTAATVCTLILSDVIGDDLATIGSGPTAPDRTTFADGIAVLERYGIWRVAPLGVRRHLLRGRKKTVPETLKPGSPQLRTVHYQIIGNNAGMVRAVVEAARHAGLQTVVLPPLVGEAAEAAKQFVRAAKARVKKRSGRHASTCIIAGGEPTVTVTGRGKGGRAQEFAVAAAFEVEGLAKTWLAAIGTDGTDGPTDAAGAVVSGKTVERADRSGVSLRTALRQHDTYPALRALKCHIRTGPTGTNVNDLYLLLLL